MISCGHQGRPDMYGLGIRLGIYLQWFGEMLIGYFDDADISDIRLLGLLLSGAVVLALLVRVADGDIHPVDVYIVLQLAAGSYVFLMPMYIWKMLTCCNPRWDPLRHARDVRLPVFSIATMILLVVISALGVWFFTTYLPTKGHLCEYYGFFFAKIRLDNAAYIVVNVIVYVIILLVCFNIVLSRMGFWDGQFRTRKHHRRKHRHRRHSQERTARRKRARQEQKKLLRTMRGISNLVVYGLHITAIELTIRWNQFDNIDGVDTSAQTIPLLVSIGILVRLIVSHYANKADTSNTDEEPTAAEPRPRPVEPASTRGHGLQRDPVPEPVVLDDYIAGIDLDNVSDYFAHGSDAYWLARMAIQNRDAAEQAAAMEWQAVLRARGEMPRPARAHVRGMTV